MDVSTHERTKVFISYSHEDAKWLQRLRVHLRPLERQYDLEIWDDTRIAPGAKWRDEIERALASAKVAVLLMSAHFLASDFIARDELPPLLEAAAKDGAVILPVILSSSRFSRTPNLYQFRAVNDPKNPLDSLPENKQEQVLVEVTGAIESALGYSPESGTEEQPWKETTTRSAFLKAQQGYDSETSHADNKPERQQQSPKRWPKLHPTIWVAIIGGLITLVVSYWQYGSASRIKDENHQYTGRVSDATTSKPIYSAQVSVEEDQQVPQVRATDSAGIFSVVLHKSTKVIRIRVDADGYEVYERNIPFVRTGIEDIRLKPLRIIPTITPTPQPTPSVRIKTQSTRAKRRCTPEDILVGKCERGECEC